jgi:hypothetical protein
MKQLDWKSFAIGVLFTTTLIFGVAAKEVKQKVEKVQPDKWEYRAFKVADATEFDDDEVRVLQEIFAWGNVGFELVDVESVIKNGNTVERIYYFKKPKF